MKQLKVKEVLYTLNFLVENKMLTGEELISVCSECCSSDCGTISVEKSGVCFSYTNCNNNFFGIDTLSTDKEIFDRFVKSLFSVAPSAIINDKDGLKISWLPDEFVAIFEFYYDEREATFTFTMVEDKLSQIQFISNEESLMESIKKFNGLMTNAIEDLYNKEI